MESWEDLAEVDEIESLMVKVKPPRDQHSGSRYPEESRHRHRSGRADGVVSAVT